MLTNFRFIFTPRKILNTMEYIKEKHKNINERFNSLAIDDKYLKKLLKTIDGLDKTELVGFSYKLKKHDLYLLAGYMSDNQYNIDLEKIYIILKNRFRDEFIRVLFRGFKNHYYNREFNTYFLKFLNLSKNPHDMLNMSSDTLEVIKKWLKQDNMISAIVHSCLTIKKEFRAFMSAFRIEEDTLIYKDCRKYLYRICDKEYYIQGNEVEILNVLKTYTLDEKVAFMNNYLTLLEVDEFQELILDYIYYSYGEPNEGIYSNIWQRINSNAVEKYKMWLVQKHMKEFFGQDERYVFWYGYIKNLDAQLLHVNERQLFIDFGKFIVAEFRNIGNAAYVYRINDFDKYFRRLINKGTVYSDGNFKYRAVAMERIIHSGNWQYRTSNLIREVMNNDQRY